MKHIFLIVVTFLSMFCYGQTKYPFSTAITGGIKRTVFEIARQDVIVSNPDPGFDASIVIPQVSNTIAFFCVAKGSKPISRKWTIVNTIGVDMQQLDILSGFKKDPGSNTAISGYSRTEYTELLPRLKLDVGLSYRLFRVKTGDVAISVSVGEVIALSTAGNTYSFVEPGLIYTGERILFFINAAIMPYNIQIKNMDTLVGNIGAASVSANYSYRMYEMGIGIGYRL